MSTPRRELIDGCPHINRAEIMKRTGMFEQAQANLYTPEFGERPPRR